VGHPILLLRGYDKPYMYGQLSYARPNEGGLLCPSQFCARRPAAARLFFGNVAAIRNLACSRFTFRAKEMPAVSPRKNARLDSVCGLPQDYRMQFKLRAGLARATALKRLTRLRISREAARRSGYAARADT
jgi:hypothetical protein